MDGVDTVFSLGKSKRRFNRKSKHVASRKTGVASHRRGFNHTEKVKGYRFSRPHISSIPIQRISSEIQAKVTIGKAGDRFEREADDVADKVTSGRDAGEISRIPAGGLKAQTQLIQREAEDGEGGNADGMEELQAKCKSCEQEGKKEKEQNRHLIKPDADSADELAQAAEEGEEDGVQEKCERCDNEDKAQKQEADSDDEGQALQAKEDKPDSITDENTQTQLVQREAEDDAEEEAESNEGPVGGEDDPDAPDCTVEGGESEPEEEGESESGGEEATGEGAGEEGGGSEGAEPAEGGVEGEGEDIGCGEEESGDEEAAEAEGGPTEEPNAEQSCGGSATEEEAEASEDGEGGEGEEAAEGEAPAINPAAGPSCADEVAEPEDTSSEMSSEGETSTEGGGEQQGECQTAQTQAEDYSSESDDSAQTDVQREAEASDSSDQSSEEGSKQEASLQREEDDTQELTAQREVDEAQELSAQRDEEEAQELSVQREEEDTQELSAQREEDSDAQEDCDSETAQDQNAQTREEDEAQELATQREQGDSRESEEQNAQTDGEGASDCSAAESEAEAQTRPEADDRRQRQKSEIASQAIKHRDSGDPLVPSLREKLENSLHMDLSSVRVHTGSKAHDANKGLRAKAFTHKNHIWLGGGRSQSDERLMAHEVTHTVQQGAITKAKAGDSRPRREESEQKDAAGNPPVESALAQQQEDVDEGVVQEAPIPQKRVGEHQWQPRHLQALRTIKAMIDDTFDNEEDSRKNTEIRTQIGGLVNAVWRDFKTYVDGKGGLAGLEATEIAFVESEKKSIAEAEKGLTPETELSPKDRAMQALRRKGIQTMGKLIGDTYAVYWMLNDNTRLNWSDFKNEKISLDMKSVGLSISQASTGKEWVRSNIRTEIYSLLAKAYNIDIEDVWNMIRPDEPSEKTEGGVAGSEKSKSLSGKYSQKRLRQLTLAQRKLLRRLPKSTRDSKDKDALVNLLDRLLTLPAKEQNDLIERLHDQEKEKQQTEKEEAAKSKAGEAASEKDKKPAPADIDVERLQQERQAQKDFAEILQDPGIKKDETAIASEQTDLAAFLKTLSEEERKAFLEFLKSQKGKPKQQQPKSAKELFDHYKSLTESDKEALRVRKLLDEQGVDPSQKMTDAKQKAIRVMVQDQTKKAEQAQQDVKKINEDMAFVASLVSDGDAKKALIPLDLDDFRVMPEMMMLYGLMDGAGSMSTEIRGAADSLKTQIGKLQEKILKEIRNIGIEMAVHAGLSAIPFVGWAKAAFTVGRLVKLGYKLNKLRKRLLALQRGYDTFLKVRSAVETARTIVNKAPGFVRKFEQARKNWLAMQKQLENLEAAEDIEGRMELAFDQLMEQMDQHMEALEPFFEKMYLPENVRDDKEALLKVLFNMPKGIDAFGDMLSTYRKFGDTSDPKKLELLYYKGMHSGALLYPLVGFVIAELSTALEGWISREKSFTDFLGRRRRWGKKGKLGKSKTGRKLGSLWPRKMQYKGHSKGQTPQFTPFVKKGGAYLDEQIPKENIHWKYRIKLYLRYKLRQIVKYLNRKNWKVWGRPKPKRRENAQGWDKVPLPPFKYRLKSAGKSFDVNLYINPGHKRTIKALDYDAFKGKGFGLPDLRTSEGIALKKWLAKKGYLLTKLPVIGWHIRRAKRYSVRNKPLHIENGLIQQGLESTKSAALDRFVAAGRVIAVNEQLPDGFHLQTRSVPRTRGGAVEKHVVKKHPRTSPAYPLYLDDDVKLTKTRPSGKQALVLDSTVPNDPSPDSEGRPHKVSDERVGYTVNKPRGYLPKVPGMRSGYDKGHVIAHRFNGSNNVQNLVPMKTRLNQRGAWYKQEAALAKSFKRAWQAAVMAGQTVAAYMTAVVSYLPGSKSRRPSSFDFSWRVTKNGKSYDSKSISNVKNK